MDKCIQKRSIFESVSIISMSAFILGILLNYFCNLAPIGGNILIIYVVTVFFATIYLSCRILKWILSDTTPLKYDMKTIQERYKFIPYLGQSFNNCGFYPETVKGKSLRDYSRKDLSTISKVLEQKLISSWYLTNVSQARQFPSACKDLIDQILNRLLQICGKINTTSYYNNVITIYLKHLIEYQNAKRKQEKYSGTIMEHFKSSHPASKQQNFAKEHCNLAVKTILRELLPLELRGTRQSEFVESILTKKLYDLIEEILINPTIIFKTIKNSLECECRSDFNSDVSSSLKGKSESFRSDSAGSVVEEALSKVIQKSTAPILHNAVEMKTSNMNDTGHVVKRRIKSDTVKVHNRYENVDKIETWSSDMDLSRLSIGHDLLESLEGEPVESRLSGLWELDLDTFDTNDKSTESSFIFGDVEIQDSGSEVSACSPIKTNVRQSNEQSNFIQTMQSDLQMTVNQAKHKFGDIQDEAAGMIEGILDFGMAGIRKGLHITGIHESPPLGSSVSPSKETAFLRKENDHRILPCTQSENHTMGVSQSPGTHKQKKSTTLKPQQNVTSQDFEFINIEKKPLSKSANVSPYIDIPRAKVKPSVVTRSDSPELEYEEQTDLATTIAKLRSLLHQRDSDTTTSDTSDNWWDGVSETQGREAKTSHWRSDKATVADEFETVSMSSIANQESTNNIPRLDKLLQRTVTGVFNSIKTAVGGDMDDTSNGDSVNRLPPDQLHWRYAPSSNDMSTILSHFLTRRTTDVAEDSLTSIDDKLDDVEVDEEFESWSVVLELLSAVSDSSHVFTVIASRLLSDPMEPVIKAWYESFNQHILSTVTSALSNIQNDCDINFEMTQEADCKIVTCQELIDSTLKRIPGKVRLVCEDKIIHSLNNIFNSLNYRDMNRDFVYQLIDLTVLHYMAVACGRKSMVA